VLLVHRDGAEAALPEMAGLPLPCVNDARIAAMHRRERAAQAVCVAGHQDEMHVIGHQAPGQDLHVGRTAVLREQSRRAHSRRRRRTCVGDRCRAGYGAECRGRRCGPVGVMRRVLRVYLVHRHRNPRFRYQGSAIDLHYDDTPPAPLLHNVRLKGDQVSRILRN
jgi:hypothetical protein